MLTTVSNAPLGLSDLNAYMKQVNTGIIVPSQFIWSSLLDLLKGQLDTGQSFDGDLAKLLIQTAYPYTASAAGDGIPIVYPQNAAWIPMYIPLKKIQVNAGITHDALNRATGGNSSWGSAVDRVLADQRREFKWFQEILAMGDGTGRLARVSDSTYSGGTLTVTCDNTYWDFGIENVALFKKGMWIEIFNAAGAQVGDAVDGIALATTSNAWKVTGVTFGNRNNGAATTGTFTITVANDIDLLSGLTRVVNDGAVIYLYGTRSNSALTTDAAGSYSYGGTATGKCYEVTNMEGSVDVPCSVPMGLLGLVQDGITHTYTDGTIDCTLDVFQGLARASYETLNSKIWTGTDYAGTDGTPSDWSLSTVTDAIMQNQMDTGESIDMLLCSQQLAMAMYRLMVSSGQLSIHVDSTAGLKQVVVGSEMAETFRGPNGELIPIKISRTIPRNVLYGIRRADIRWFVKGGFDFFRLNGQVWDKSYNDRLMNFEAPFGGWENMGEERADTHFIMQDLADNVT